MKSTAVLFASCNKTQRILGCCAIVGLGQHDEHKDKRGCSRLMSPRAIQKSGFVCGISDVDLFSELSCAAAYESRLSLLPMLALDF